MAETTHHMTPDQKAMVAAVQTGNLQTIAALTTPGLFSRQRVTMEERLPENETYLMIAMAAGQSSNTIASIIGALKDQSREGIQKYLQMRDNKGNTAFMHAVMSGNAEGLDQLIDQAQKNGVPLNMASLGLQIKNDAGETALSLAAAKGNAHMITALLDAGAPIENNDKLMAAALASGDRMTVGVLLKKSPDLAFQPIDDGRGGHYNAVQWAIKNNQPGMIKTIRSMIGEERYADLLTETHSNQSSAIHIAARSGYKDIAGLVAGMSPEQKTKILDTRDIDGRPALSKVVLGQYGDGANAVAMAETLIKAGASHQMSQDSNALWYAAYNQNKAVVDVLVKHGDINSLNKNGFGILHLLANSGSEKAASAIVMLAQKGLNLDTVAHDGQTAEEIIDRLKPEEKLRMQAAMAEARALQKSMRPAEKSAPAPVTAREAEIAQEEPKQQPQQETASKQQPQRHQPQTLAGKMLQSLDANHDGVISAGEFSALGKAGKAALSKALNTNGGGVDKGELKNAILDAGLNYEDSRIRDGRGKAGKTEEQKLDIAASNLGKSLQNEGRALRNAGVATKYGHSHHSSPTLASSHSMPGQHHPGGHSKA